MKKNRKTRGFGVLALACLLVGSIGAFVGAQAASAAPATNALDYLRVHGYLPIHGADTLARAKAAAAGRGRGRLR